MFDGSPILDCLRLAICLELYDICFDTNHCGGIGYTALVYTAMVVPFAGQEIKLQLDLFRFQNCRFFEYMAERGYRLYHFLRVPPDISLLIEFDRSNFFSINPVLPLTLFVNVPLEIRQMKLYVFPWICER